MQYLKNAACDTIFEKHDCLSGELRVRKNEQNTLSIKLCTKKKI